MSNLPAICIVTNAKKTDANLVWAAMGRGPNTFSRKLCPVDPLANENAPPTHWLMSDASAEDSDVAIWQAMTAGNLPPLPDGTVWGVDGIISAADAMAATDGSQLHIYSVAGDVAPLDHANACLATEGLQFVPEGGA